MATHKMVVAEGDTINLCAKNGVLVIKVGRIRVHWFRPPTAELTLSGAGVSDTLSDSAEESSPNKVPEHA